MSWGGGWGVRIQENEAGLFAKSEIMGWPLANYQRNSHRAPLKSGALASKRGKINKLYIYKQKIPERSKCPNVPSSLETI